MKVYLCYSKTKIKQINDEQRVKKELAKIISDAFDLFDILEAKDVILCQKKISNGIDCLIVIDTAKRKKMSGLVKRIEEKLMKALQEDQGTKTEYNVRTIVGKNQELMRQQNSDVQLHEKNVQMGDKEMERGNSELDYEKRAEMYVPVIPSYSFERVILPKDVLEKIEESLSILHYEKKVFEEWGLYEIQPNPSSSLSFFGPSGTGKTMAAEAVAQKLGKKILKVSYADVESKYHGEGPKMVKAIFLAAEKADAVLFFDEADSLLSKRLTNVTQGSEQAINSMRSQLLICLEEFKGIVIFATNLVVNYDQAFLTRLISVEFKLPNVETRRQIWDTHIRPLDKVKSHRINIPLADDVNTEELACKYEFAGREIRNAVISACIRAAMAGKNIVNQQDFLAACDKIVKEKESIANEKNHTVSEKSKEVLKNTIVEKLKEGENKDVFTKAEA